MRFVPAGSQEPQKPRRAKPCESSRPTGVTVYGGRAGPRRRGLHIPRFAWKGKARSFHRSASPTQTRFAGLCVGGRCGGLKALHPSAKFPARKIRLRFLIPSEPLGPGSVQNSGLCHFTAAPGSDQPWQRVRDRARAGRRRFHEPGTGESGTRPYGALRDPSPLIQRPERAAAGKFPVKQGSG